MKIHHLLLAALTAALAATACSSSDDHDHDHADGGVHTSPYPACDAIIKACHLYDIGPGAVHDCHDTGHGAKSDADCAPKKDACLKTCADAAAAEDAGAGQDASSGTDAAADASAD